MFASCRRFVCPTSPEHLAVLRGVSHSFSFAQVLSELQQWLFLFSVLCFSWSCHSRAHVHGICAICPLTSSRFIHIMRDFERDGRRGDFWGLSKEKARISPAGSNESWQKETRKQDVAEGDDNIPYLFGLQQQQQFVILSVAGACQHLPKHSPAHLRPHTGCSASA